MANTPAAAGSLKDVIALVDSIVATAKSVARARTPGEEVTLAIAMLQACADHNVTTLDDALSTLGQLKPLIDRITAA
jgi:hypothetical protein